MKSKIVFFTLGMTISAIAFLLLGSSSRMDKRFEYIQLQSDYKIGNLGYLKKGTILRSDQPMDEGFTRYILYLNLKDGETTAQYEIEHKDQIIPYWLLPIDTLK